MLIRDVKNGILMQSNNFAKTSCFRPDVPDQMLVTKKIKKGLTGPT